MEGTIHAVEELFNLNCGACYLLMQRMLLIP